MQTTPIRFDCFNRLISFEALMFFFRAVSKFSTLFLLLAATRNWSVQGNEPSVPNTSVDPKEKFRMGIADIIAPPHAGIAVPGQNGWIFFDKELRHLAAPRFWGAPSATPTETNDPLPAILDFKSQLDEAGIDLLVIPVPPKAAIYPDQLLSGFPAPPSTPAGLAEQDADFVKVLESHGVKVLDLTEDFLKARAEGLDTHCRTDTHWSPEGIRLASQKIASKVSSSPWLNDQDRLATQTQNSTVQIHGDLAQPDAPAEILPARIVTESAVSGSTGITDSRKSPVVLLGDSHNLVFHTGGEMHSTGAGLPDQLCHELGFPMDVVAVMGSGSTAAQRSLARRKDNLAGKKLLIWCFSTREFTQGQGWPKVQVIKPATEQTPKP